MAEAAELELRQRALPRPKRIKRQQALPIQPEGWRAVSQADCERNASLWPQPGNPVMVPFPQDWRKGVIESKEAGNNYVIKLDGTGSLMTLSLSQFLVKT